MILTLQVVSSIPTIEQIKDSGCIEYGVEFWLTQSYPVEIALCNLFLGPEAQQHNMCAHYFKKENLVMWKTGIL